MSLSTLISKFCNSTSTRKTFNSYRSFPFHEILEFYRPV